MRIVLKPGWPGQIIAATGQSVVAGEPVEVDDDLGGSLLAQVDKWAKAPKSKVNEGTTDTAQEGKV